MRGSYHKSTPEWFQGNSERRPHEEEEGEHDDRKRENHLEQPDDAQEGEAVHPVGQSQTHCCTEFTRRIAIVTMADWLQLSGLQ